MCDGVVKRYESCTVLSSQDGRVVAHTYMPNACWFLRVLDRRGQTHLG